MTEHPVNRTALLTERHADKMVGAVSSWDRIVLKGHLQPLTYAKGMTSYLYRQGILIFDYPKFAAPLRDTLRTNAAELAEASGVAIEFIRKSRKFRKEDRIASIIADRGDHPGLVHIFAAMERCPSYSPWRDPETKRYYVRSKEAKCLHYYFYFIDADLGLCYLRVPTWCPFGLQFYCNGHNWLAAQLSQEGIDYEMHDNAFLALDDCDRATELAGTLDAEWLTAKLADYARRYCPVADQLNLTYHWTIWQAEYATDLIFKDQASLQAIYPHLLDTLITTTKPSDIATFLGRKVHGNFQGEMGNRLNTRQEGTRIRHQMGPVAIKMYDKFGFILRIETTVNNVAFFRHQRTVRHRDGTASTKMAPMKKALTSLSGLQALLHLINQHYLAFISTVETPEVGVRKLHKVTETITVKQHTYKGFNLLNEEDASCLRLLVQPEFLVDGISNAALRQHLTDKNSGQVSRLIKRLRVHGILKKVANRYRYFLTTLGQQVVLTAFKLKDLFVIPQLNR